VSLRYPFKPILLGTFCPDGGDFSDFFLDKIGIALSADTKPLSDQERQAAVEKILAWESGTMPLAEREAILEQEEDLKYVCLCVYVSVCVCIIPVHVY
jgi:Mg-chelatase subunit ChlI